MSSKSLYIFKFYAKQLMKLFRITQTKRTSSNKVFFFLFYLDFLVTFYEEEKENTGYINSVIAEIQSDLSEYQNHTTFAIHHAIPLYEYYENIE